jgi:hypothetical protein
MATAPDTRSTSAPGESRNAHFSDAAAMATGPSVDEQRNIMAGFFRNRRNDILDYGGDEYDD